MDTRADEFFAVFREPLRALDAALEIQRSLRKRSWPDRADVRVRIGMHTGRPTLTETGYVGIAVHTAARICSAGHGGQILLSSATRECLIDAPSTVAVFKSLGRHSLAGLHEREALFQVSVSDLPAKFPRLRTTLEG